MYNNAEKLPKLRVSSPEFNTSSSTFQQQQGKLADVLKVFTPQVAKHRACPAELPFY